jgi:hypothetical protein
VQAVDELLLAAEPHPEDQVAADRLPARGEHLDREPDAVADRPAVAVGAVVGVR